MQGMQVWSLVELRFPHTSGRLSPLATITEPMHSYCSERSSVPWWRLTQPKSNKNFKKKGEVHPIKGKAGQASGNIGMRGALGTSVARPMNLLLRTLPFKWSMSNLLLSLYPSPHSPNPRREVDLLSLSHMPLPWWEWRAGYLDKQLQQITWGGRRVVTQRKSTWCQQNKGEEC